MTSTIWVQSSCIGQFTYLLICTMPIVREHIIGLFCTKKFYVQIIWWVQIFYNSEYSTVLIMALVITFLSFVLFQHLLLLQFKMWTMNSFPRYNRKIITEDRNVHVLKHGEKAGILAREQNRITLLERRSKKRGIEGKVRHRALCVLVRMRKHSISAIRHAKIEGIFSSCQEWDIKCKYSYIWYSVKNLWDWKIWKTCNDKIRKNTAEQRPFDKERTW